MSPEILVLLFVFLIFLLIGSIGMSLYLLHDIRSGSYRKLISASEQHADFAENVKSLRKKNLET